MKRLDIVELLKGSGQIRTEKKRLDLEKTCSTDLKMGPFEYHELSEPLKAGRSASSGQIFRTTSTRSRTQTITTEIASGRFEDDIRRMRMAAWHGADHIMVIRHMGQSHIDGLMEGTPQGIGGVPDHQKAGAELREKLST